MKIPSGDLERKGGGGAAGMQLKFTEVVEQFRTRRDGWQLDIGLKNILVLF